MKKHLRFGIRTACTLFLILSIQLARAADFWLEAECAEVGVKWDRMLSDSASGGAYVVSQFIGYGGPDGSPENRVRFMVDAPGAGGEYTLFARVLAPNTNQDSYWVRINEGEWLVVKTGLYRPGQRFHWFSVTTTNLTAGSNTIDFTFREEGTQLDKILLTDSGFIPTGAGAAAGSCLDFPERPVDHRAFWLEAECGEVGTAWTTETSEEASGGAYVVPLLSTPYEKLPSLTPSSAVKFTITDPDLGSGSFGLLIRTKTDYDNTAAYFWLRINGGYWTPISSYPNKGLGWRWSRTDYRGGGLHAGTNTVEIGYRVAGHRLDKVLLTSYYNLSPIQFGNEQPPCDLTPPAVTTVHNTFRLEAECGELGAKWSVEPNDDASGGLIAVERGSSTLETPPADDPENLLRFTLEAADSGAYNLFARINGPTGYDDSFWVRANGGEWFKWWWGIRNSEGFVWNQIPTYFLLHAGTNTIDFAYREDGTLLDKVVISTMPYLPEGEGEPATNCGESVPAIAASPYVMPETGRAATQESASVVNVFPNPARDYLTLRLDGPYAGNVLALITDVHGRRLREMRYLKYAGTFQEELSVAELPSGIYHLRLLEGDIQTVRPFVKL